MAPKVVCFDGTEIESPKRYIELTAIGRAEDQAMLAAWFLYHPERRNALGKLAVDAGGPEAVQALVRAFGHEAQEEFDRDLRDGRLRLVED